MQPFTIIVVTMGIFNVIGFICLLYGLYIKKLDREEQEANV